MTLTMSNSLDALKQTGTVVVSDSGDFASISKYNPQDATTNPSLILAAAKDPQYAKLIDVAIEYAKKKGGDTDAMVDAALDRLVSWICLDGSRLTGNSSSSLVRRF